MKPLKILVNIIVDNQDSFGEKGKVGSVKNTALAHEAVRMIVDESQTIGNEHHKFYADGSLILTDKDGYVISEYRDPINKTDPIYINEHKKEVSADMKIAAPKRSKFSTKEVRLRRRFNFKSRRHQETDPSKREKEHKEGVSRELLVFSVEVDRIYRKTN